MIDAFKIASSQPWAITPDGLETVLAVLDRMGDPDALATKLGRPLDNAHTVENRNGVAVIPVTGPIARYSNMFTEISGATSTQMLATDFQAALDDPSIHSIVLNIDSPGGTAAGINELSNVVYAARGTKPVVAYGGGTMASAAYWLASAADSIVIDQTAIVGSIGVVLSHVDTSARDAKSGIARHDIVSSVSPDKRADPATESGRAKAQKVVDDLASVFVGTVARNRGTEAATVAENYGRGGVLVGQAAINAGMADKIGSLEGVIASLQTSKTRRYSMANANKQGSVTVSNTADLQIAIEAGYDPANISIATVDESAIKSAAYAEGLAAGKAGADAAATAAAVTSERVRLNDLAAIAEPGFEALHKAAIEGGQSAADFALAQMRDAKDRGVTIGAIKRDSQAAQHSAPGSAEAKAGAWDRTVSKHSGKKAA